MSAYSNYFLNTSPAIVELDCIEISHPKFSTTYRLVRNATAGVTVTHEGPTGPFFYEYYPMQLKPLGSQTDLDQGIQLTLGDVGQLIKAEIRAVNAANARAERPRLNYRTYQSDDLSVPLFGPAVLEVRTITSNKEGSLLEAQAPYLNITRTGKIYKVEDFSMLRAFFKSS